MGPSAGLDRCGKSRFTGIRSPDRPACSQSLYLLSYRAHKIKNTSKLLACFANWHPDLASYFRRDKIGPIIQSVPLATEPGISLIILPLMRILQRNLTRTKNTHYRHTLQTRTTDTHYRHVLQTRTADTHYRHAL